MPTQVILFTETIAHMRGEFFFDTRIVFESAFITDFDPERVLQKQTLYSIQDVSAELELIALNVCSAPLMLYIKYYASFSVLQTAGYSYRRVRSGEG